MTWLYANGAFGGDLAIAAGTTNYAAIGGSSGATPFSDARYQLKIGASFTASNLWANVSAVSGVCTVTDRKNGAAGGQSISINATGTFEDTTGTTALVSGDLYNVSLATVGADTCTIKQFSLLISDGGAGTTTPHISSDSGVVAWNTGQQFVPICGSARVTSTEAAAQIKFEYASTLSKLRFYVPNNSRSGASTFRIRINGSNGSQAISLGASTTGAVEDTTHSDSISVGDLVCIGKDSDALTGTATAITYQVTGSSGSLPLATTWPNGQTVLGVKYLPFMVASNEATESNAAIKARSASLLSNLQASLSANSNGVVATIDLRVNSASPSGGPAISYAASETGLKEDLTGSATLAATDLVNYRSNLNGGAGGLTLNVVAARQSAVPPPALLHLGAFDLGAAQKAWFVEEASLQARFDPELAKTDGSAFTLNVSETITLTETPGKAITHPLSQSISISDAAVKAVGKPISETVTYSESRVVADSKALSQSLPVFDNSTKAIGKSSSDSISYSESRTVADSVALAQSLPVTDAAAKSVSHPASEALSVSDAATKATGKAGSDSISYSESSVKDVGQHLSQSLPLTESTAKDVAKVLSQSLPLTDAESTAIGRAVSETIAYSESRVASLARALSESIALTESRTADVGKASSETITLTDAKAAALSMALSQSLVIAEAIAKAIGLAKSQPVAFSEALTDAFSVELSEMLALVDAKAAALSVVKTQGLTLNEQIALSTLKALSESTVFSDSVVVGRTWHVEPGSFTVTGVDAALRASRKILADPGAYSLTGETARLIAARLIVLGTGRFTETPKAQRFILARAFIAAKGTVTESGKSARLLASRTITAAKGTLQEIGKSMDFVLFGRRTLTAETGRFVLTGKSVQILVGDGRYPATREWLKRGTRHHWDGL